MKKPLAAISASALGVLAAGVSAAAPAAALPVVPQCATIEGQISPTFDPTDEWFADCVPQYGFGKVEFNIESDVPFPDAFVELGDSSVTTSTNLNPAFTTYMDEGPQTSSVVDLALDSETSTSQTYRAIIAAPITSTGPATEGNTPEAVAIACGFGEATYTHGYRITFGATFTTFTQTIDGVPWVYTIGGTPVPTFLFFDSEGSGFCYVDENGENRLELGAEEPVFLLIPPFGFPESEEGPFYDLGSFSRTPVPALAATGADATLALTIAGGLLGVGVLTFGLGAALRRKTRAS